LLCAVADESFNQRERKSFIAGPAGSSIIRSRRLPDQTNAHNCQLLERDLAEVGQAIAATSVLSTRTERPPAETQPDWVGAAQEPWRKLLADGIQDALDEDTGEMATIHPQSASDHVEGLLVAFRYRDASDNSSRRMLLCWRCYEQYGALYVRGYCTLREALRTFRPDRMTSLREMRSDASISDPIAYFERFVVADHATEQATIDQAARAREAAVARRQLAYNARTDCIAGLRILAYIALADGPKRSATSKGPSWNPVSRFAATSRMPR
jgi:hypothetical protein